jgi:hypothetical protein
VYIVPFDAGQEGAATGVDVGAITVDEILELVADDKDVELTREEVVAELEELEEMVEVLNEVIDGVALELVVLELLISAVEEAMVLAVVLTLIDTELNVAVVPAVVDIELVVVTGRIYPATLVLRRLAVLTKD